MVCTTDSPDGAACFGIAVQSVRVQTNNIVPRGRYDENGSTFLPDRWFNRALQIATTGLVLAMALIAVFLLLRKMELPMPGPEASHDQVLALDA